MPESRSIETNLNTFKFVMIDPVITLDESGKWGPLWSELFLREQALRKEDE